MTLQLESRLFSGWAMGERYMVIGDIIEEMYFLFLQCQCSTDGMDWGVAPSFVEETAVSVEGIEEVQIGL